jgi:hypothetical protein
MASAELPGTPRELWAALIAICPAFAADLPADEVEERERENTATFHFVMQPFTTYFGTDQATLSEKQLKQLAVLINRAVENADDLENAVATCFLEHLHQIRAYKVLAPFLSAGAKQKTHA